LTKGKKVWISLLLEKVERLSTSRPWGGSTPEEKRKKPTASFLGKREMKEGAKEKG